MNMFEVSMSADGESVEVMMYGPIGSSIFQEGITAQQVGAALAKVPNAKRINVRLNSPGGSVWEGMTIRTQLAEHPARVTAEVEGLAASCASVIAMAADEIRMHAGSRMMVHEAHRMTQGDVREHEKAIAVMRSVNEGAADIYAKRTGQTLERVRDLMAAETWLSPEKAVELGFADKVVAAKSGGPRMSFDLSMFGYRNVPASFATHEPPPKSTTQETKPMSFARIAMALGLSGEGAEEAAVMAAIDRLKNDRQRNELLLSELRHITKKDSADELLGAVRGLADASAQLSAAQTELTAAKAQLEHQERMALITADATNPKGRKLTPQVAKLYENKPVAELRAYLEVATILPGTATAAMSGGASGAQPLTGTTQSGTEESDVVLQDGVAKLAGKAWEEMTFSARHDLHFTDKRAYEALRSNFEQRRGA